MLRAIRLIAPEARQARGGVHTSLMKTVARETKEEPDDDEWRLEERVAGAHRPDLRRLPDPEHLPVIVATRLSLSEPQILSLITDAR